MKMFPSTASCYDGTDQHHNPGIFVVEMEYTVTHERKDKANETAQDDAKRYSQPASIDGCKCLTGDDGGNHGEANDACYVEQDDDGDEVQTAIRDFVSVLS